MISNDIHCAWHQLRISKLGHYTKKFGDLLLKGDVKIPVIIRRIKPMLHRQYYVKG